MRNSLARIFPRAKKLLNHAAISLEGRELDEEYLSRYGLSEKEFYSKKGRILQKLLETQVRLKIPILTVLLLSSKKIGVGFSSKVRFSEDILNGLKLGFIQKHQVKVSPIGKWYELPSNGVELMKMLITETKDYDRFFLNLCIYYDGQSEILDACKLIARRVEKRRLSPEEITKDTLADNMYSSNFLPPNLIILNDKRALQGLLLWDSSDADIFITGKPWPEFDEKQFRRIAEQWRASLIYLKRG